MIPFYFCWHFLLTGWIGTTAAVDYGGIKSWTYQLETCCTFTIGITRCVSILFSNDSLFESHSEELNNLDGVRGWCTPIQWQKLQVVYCRHIIVKHMAPTAEKIVYYMMYLQKLYIPRKKVFNSIQKCNTEYTCTPFS